MDQTEILHSVTKSVCLVDFFCVSNCAWIPQSFQKRIDKINNTSSNEHGVKFQHHSKLSESVDSEHLWILLLLQMVVSVTSGPWDDLFGGGNIPAFVVAAGAAAISGVLALTMLPSPPAEVVATKDLTAGGFH